MEDKLKQRLVGACVLGVIAVLVVPWILGEPEVTQRRQRAPERAPEVKLPPVLPPGNPEPEKRTPSPDGSLYPPLPPASSPPPRASREAEPASDQSPRQRTPDARPARPEPPASASTPLGWVVQVATFSQSENAEKLERRLTGAGFKAVSVADGRYWRVLVSGFADRSEADGAKARLQLDFGLTGVIQQRDG